MPLRFIDLFSGLGGFHVAARNLGMECVFASEIDPRLQALYESNFRRTPVGDIRQVDAKQVPGHDLLCAGFPCQPFSKAGFQLGRQDQERGTLFDHIVDILRFHRPAFFVLENVAHFVRHDSGNTYKVAKSALEHLGYEVKEKKLSPHQFGVPQIRDRIYLVGALGGLSEFSWPIPTSELKDLDIRSVLEESPPDAKLITSQAQDCIRVWQEFLKAIPSGSKLPSFPIWSMEFGATYPYERNSLADYSTTYLRSRKGSFGVSLSGMSYDEILASVPSHARRPNVSFPDWKKKFIRQNREFFRMHREALTAWLPSIRKFPSSLQKLEWNCQGEERDIWRYVLQFRASGLRVKRPNTAPSLVAMTSTQIPIIAWENRYMTIRECARLQSLESLARLPHGNFGFEAMGNAVNVKLVELILSKLCDNEIAEPLVA